MPRFSKIGTVIIAVLIVVFGFNVPVLSEDKHVGQKEPDVPILPAIQPDKKPDKKSQRHVFCDKLKWPVTSNGIKCGAARVVEEGAYSAPRAFMLDTAKLIEEREVGLLFYMLHENLTPFKGKPLLFSAQVKKLHGEGNLTVRLRCKHIDDKGNWHHILASPSVAFKADIGEWKKLKLYCMVPANAEINAIDFKLIVEKTTQPATYLIDDCAVEVVPAENNAIKPSFAATNFLDKPKKMVLVRNGQPLATIIVAKDRTKTVDYAVKELVEHVKLATKATLPVKTDGEMVEGPTIHVGSTNLTERLGLAPRFFAPDHWIIRRYRQALILSGGDNKFNLSPIGKKRVPFGTLFSIYEFLERMLGVRWYWPGELGRMVPNLQEIVIGKVNLQGKPSYDVRFAWNAVHKDPNLSIKEVFTWWRRMRWGGVAGSPIGMHSFTKWNEKFGKQHPEWFALQHNGQRLSSAKGAGSELGHLCYSNPEVLTAVVNEKLRQFDDVPWKKYRSVMTGDSIGLYYCQCPGCQAMTRPGRGNSGMYSHAMWTFVNNVAKEIRKTHPDRFITCDAYSGYKLVPQEVNFESNVAVTICEPTFPHAIWNPEAKKNYVELIDRWAKKCPDIYVWDYWDQRRKKGVEVSPSIVPHAIKEWFSLDYGRVKGHAVELLFGTDNWMFDMLNVYVGFRLLWNMDQDVDEILDEFYEKFLGPAGPGVKKFYKKMEAAFIDPNTKGAPNFRWDFETCWAQTYTPEFVTEVMGDLRAAVKAAEGKKPYYSRALRILKGFEPFENESHRWKTSMTKSVKNSDLKLEEAVQAPELDGNIDDLCWQNAVTVPSFVDSFNSAQLKAQTKMQFLVREGVLYIAVKADLPEGKAYVTIPEGSLDRWVWTNESVEIFFVQDDKKYQFLLGPKDIYADNFQPDRKQKFNLEMFQWNCRGVRYKTVLHKYEWTAEIAIPLLSLELTKPTKEKPWLVNFCRNYFFETENHKDYRQELSSWRPTFGSFHNVEYYGKLFIK